MHGERWKWIGIGLGLIATLAGCATVTQNPPRDFVEWEAKRVASIGGTNGWTTVVGLHWLKQGANWAGSNATNQIVLPTRLPGSVGVFRRAGTNVVFIPASGVEVQPSGEVAMVSDLSPEPTKLFAGAVAMNVIQRGDRVGLRVRDPESARRREFHGIKRFEYDPAWRIEAKFEPFDAPRKMRVGDVTGGTQELVSPGKIRFRKSGRTHHLTLVEESGEDEYFILFSDETTGKTTYPAGRFLYVAKPGADQKMVIDFNRAFTPPCGFTDFATCPLPPKENKLPLTIRAGELNPRH